MYLALLCFTTTSKHAEILMFEIVQLCENNASTNTRDEMVQIHEMKWCMKVGTKSR